MSGRLYYASTTLLNNEGYYRKVCLINYAYAFAIPCSVMDIISSLLVHLQNIYPYVLMWGTTMLSPQRRSKNEILCNYVIALMHDKHGILWWISARPLYIHNERTCDTASLLGAIDFMHASVEFRAIDNIIQLNQSTTRYCNVKGVNFVYLTHYLMYGMA